MTQIVTRRKIQERVERRKRTKMRNQKILKMVQRWKTVEGEKLTDQKILMAWSPGVRDERQRQMMLARSQNTEDDKEV